MSEMCFNRLKPAKLPNIFGGGSILGNGSGGDSILGSGNGGGGGIPRNRNGSSGSGGGNMNSVQGSVNKPREPWASKVEDGGGGGIGSHSRWYLGRMFKTWAEERATPICER
jgi:hypothetical protein